MICHYCKKSFKPKKLWSKYCSQDCYWKARVGSKRKSRGGRIQKNCLICGIQFFVWRSHIKHRKGVGNYCSRKCLGVANGKRLSGAGHWNWKGGISPRALSSVKYKNWRTKVFERNNYTCVECGYGKGRILQADHIKSWKDYPELRFDVNNGRTLCKPCHMKTSTWGYHRR